MTTEEIDLTFAWREVGKRPPLEVAIYPVDRTAWEMFKNFHYMSAGIYKSSKCFVLAVGGRPAAFAATLNFPHATRHDIRRVNRVVTLPDWQGMGLGLVLLAKLGAAYRAHGRELRIQTASAFFARSLARSPGWVFTSRGYNKPSNKGGQRKEVGEGGGKFITGFRFVGPADAEAALLLGADYGK